MRVLICGGTGFLGRHIVNALVQQGHDPVVLSRHASPALDFAQATSPEQWRPYLQDIDAVINAVGALRDKPGQDLTTLHTTAPVALFDACAQAAAPIRRVVQISALGVDQSDTRYATTKRAADEHLLALGATGELNPVVVRPSVIFGAGGASSQLFLGLAKLPALLLPPLMQQSFIQPVAVRELAEVVAGLATSYTNGGVIEIGGPEPLSIERFIASLRAQMAYRPASVRPLPGWLSTASARLGDHLPWLPWCSETMAMLENHNITNPQTLAALLGREPTGPGQLLATLHHHA